MKLFINKSKFLNTLKKELPIKFDNNEINKLSLLTSKSVKIFGKRQLNYFTFQEFFKIKPTEQFSFTLASHENLIDRLNKRLSKHFSYLGSKKNYKFKINQIYTKSDYLVFEFMFFRK